MATEDLVQHKFNNQGSCVRCGRHAFDLEQDKTPHCKGYQYKTIMADVSSWEDPTGGMITKVAEQKFDSRGLPAGKDKLEPRELEAVHWVGEGYSCPDKSPDRLTTNQPEKVTCKLCRTASLPLKQAPEHVKRINHGIWNAGDKFTICGVATILRDKQNYWTTELPQVDCANCKEIIEGNKEPTVKTVLDIAKEVKALGGWQNSWGVPAMMELHKNGKVTCVELEIAKIEAAVSLLRLVAEQNLEHDELSKAAQEFLLKQFKE